MQAFDAGIIQVNPTQDEEGKLGFSMTAVGVGGTAYFRITPELRDFLRLCHEKHGVVGFEYGGDPGCHLPSAGGGDHRSWLDAEDIELGMFGVGDHRPVEPFAGPSGGGEVGGDVATGDRFRCGSGLS